MPELPLAPFGGGATQKDADKIRSAVPEARRVLIEQFGADPVALDKELAVAGNLASAAGEGLEFGAELAIAGRAIPGRIGGLLSALFVGQHRNPDTGKYSVGQPFAMNAAPSPVGYAPASKFGLKKNWYLPAGVTDYVPEPVDTLGIGIPEARAQDELNERLRHDAKLAEQMKALANLPNESLERIAKQGPLTTGQRIGRFFAPGITPPDVDRRSEAARFVLAQRQVAAQPQPQTLLPAPTPENVATAAEALAILVAARRLQATAAATAGQQLDPFATPIRGGSIQVGLIPALTGPAIRQRMTAKGINAELVTERIDP